MARRDPVLDALSAWHEDGDIDEATYERLRERAAADASERGRHQAARFVTGAGGFLLVAAFVVLTTVFWSDMTPAVRALFLWSVTGLVLTLALFRLGGAATDRVGTALAAVAMALGLGAVVLTRSWRPVTTLDPFVLGALVVAGSLVGYLGGRFAQANPVLPAVGLGVAFFYVPVAATALRVLDNDPFIVAIATLSVLVLTVVTALLLRDPDADHGLASGAWDGLFWVAFAALFVIVPMVWFDVLGPTFGWDDWGPIATFAFFAAWAVAVGIRSGHNGVLILGSLMLVVDAWYFGLSKGEAIGTFLALLASALVLFWLGHRLGFVDRVRGSMTSDGPDDGEG